jgi:hypothetical protein
MICGNICIQTKKMILKNNENNVKFSIWKMIWKKDVIFIFWHVILQLHMVIGW